MRTDTGVTLIELIVTLVVAGLLLGLAGGLVRNVREPSPAGAVEEMRRRTVIEPASELVVRESDSVLFLPDGRAVGRGFDPLTGEAVRQMDKR